MKDKIFEMYNDISIGQNEICKECNKDEKMEIPLSLYYVGESFIKGEDTIVFVGKTAVGGEGLDKGTVKNFTDATAFGELSIDGNEENSNIRAFYSYTRDIISSYYGDYEKGKKFVALTNIVKCNNQSTNDTTSDKAKDFCINKLGVIWKELELLSPKRIVFYTHDYYDDFIEYFRPKDCNRIFDFPLEKIAIGNKTSLRWHRRFYDKDDKIICDFLRLSHPQRMNRKDFVEAVVKWLNETKNN